MSGALVCWVLVEGAEDSESVPVAVSHDATVAQLITTAFKIVDFETGVKARQIQATCGGKSLCSSEKVASLGSDPKVMLAVSAAAPAARKAVAPRRAASASAAAGRKRRMSTSAAREQPAAKRERGSDGLTGDICDNYRRLSDAKRVSPTEVLTVPEAEAPRNVAPALLLPAVDLRLPQEASSLLFDRKCAVEEEEVQVDRPVIPDQLLEEIRNGIVLRRTGLMVNGELTYLRNITPECVVEIADAEACTVPQSPLTAVRRRSRSRSRSRSRAPPRTPARRQRSQRAERIRDDDAVDVSEAVLESKINTLSTDRVVEALRERGLETGGSRRAVLQRLEKAAVVVAQHPLHVPLGDAEQQYERRPLRRTVGRRRPPVQEEEVN